MLLKGGEESEISSGVSEGFKFILKRTLFPRLRISQEILSLYLEAIRRETAKKKDSLRFPFSSAVESSSCGFGFRYQFQKSRLICQIVRCETRFFFQTCCETIFLSNFMFYFCLAKPQRDGRSHSFPNFVVVVIRPCGYWNSFDYDLKEEWGKQIYYKTEMLTAGSPGFTGSLYIYSTLHSIL